MSASHGALTFELDGREVEAAPGRDDLAGRAAARDRRSRISAIRPSRATGADGNCRACMVEIEGERACWPPRASASRTPGMQVVTTHSPRADNARRMVFELLLADQPPSAPGSRSPTRGSGRWADAAGARSQPLPARAAPAARRTGAIRRSPSSSTPASTAGSARGRCREVQVNDVIGMAGRGPSRAIVFDLGDPMGAEQLRGLRRMRPGLPHRRPAARVGARRDGRMARQADRQVDSLCPYCGVGCQLTLPHRARADPLRRGPGRPGEPRAAVRQGAIRLRLHPPPAAG